MSGGRDWPRIERVLVTLVIAHTYGVGLALIFFTRQGAALGGWTEVEPLFFARQAGVFHLLAGTMYLIEFVRYRSVLLLLIAKTTAVVFLTTLTFVDSVPWVVPVSALADGAMGLVVYGLRRLTGRPIGG